MGIKTRVNFLARVANTMLNEAGQARFFRGYYWRVFYCGYLTHDVLDGTEKELVQLIDKKEYRK